MPIKQVFESDLMVYAPTPYAVPRVSLTPPEGGISTFFLDPANTYRIYSEYLWLFRGLFTLKDPQYPGEFEIHLVNVVHYDGWGGAQWRDSVWDGKTGAFKGQRVSLTYLSVWYMFSAPDGSVWATDTGLQLSRVNTVTWALEPPTISLLDFGANIGASYVGYYQVAVDPANDIAITRTNLDETSQVSVCRLSTGDFLRRVGIAGAVSSVFIANPPMAYAVSTDGNLTAFNYLTGEVVGVLHTGLLSGGFSWSDTAWTWDPFMRRVLFCHNPGDTMPEGHPNTRVKGFYPVAVPVGMTPPIPLRYPQKGKTVPVFNRVYGAVSEGIVGQELTYTVGNDSAATVSPGRKASETNGTVQVQLAGELAGANSIVSETSVP